MEVRKRMNEDKVMKALGIIADSLEKAAIEIREIYAEPLRDLERNVDQVQAAFPPDLAEMLYFEFTDEWILVKPRQYLGSDNFRRISAIVRDVLNGEYVSGGKDSHFRVARMGAVSTAPATQEPDQVLEFDPDDLVKHAWKGKKVGEKEWAKGSLSFGWDFKDNFKAETIAVLEKGSEVIGEHEFSLNGNLVHVEKVKK